MPWLPSKQLLRPPAPCLMTTSRPLWGISPSPPFCSHTITRAKGSFSSKSVCHPRSHDRSSREWLARPSKQHSLRSVLAGHRGSRASNSRRLITGAAWISSSPGASRGVLQGKQQCKHCHLGIISLESCVLLSNMMDQISPVRSMTTPT